MCPLSIGFKPPRKGQPLFNGQNAWSQCVLYSEVPLYPELPKRGLLKIEALTFVYQNMLLSPITPSISTTLSQLTCNGCLARSAGKRGMRRSGRKEGERSGEAGPCQLERRHQWGWGRHGESCSVCPLDISSGCTGLQWEPRGVTQTMYHNILHQVQTSLNWI